MATRAPKHTNNRRRIPTRFLKHSPWGVPQDWSPIAEGIMFVSTSSHGGVHLDPKRQAEFSELFPGFQTFAWESWYEEDEDIAAVMLAFPKHFNDMELFNAVRTVSAASARKDSRWAIIAAWLNGYHPLAKEIRARAKAFERASADKWELRSYGSPPNGYPSGSWRAAFKRLRDNHYRTAVFAKQPDKRWYTDEEIDKLTVQPV